MKLSNEPKPFELAPAGEATTPARARRRWPLIAAAVTVVALTAVSYAHRHSAAPHTSTNQPAHSSTARLGTPDAAKTPTFVVPADPSRARVATSELERVVDVLRVPVGARPLSHTPDTALEQANSAAASYTIVEKRTIWWTTSGSVSAVLQYLQHNQRTGFAPSSPLSWSTSAFTVAEAQPWLKADVVYSAAALDQGRVGIRADVEVGYIPSRPSWSLLSGITSITGTLTSLDPSSTTIRTTHDPALISTIVNQFSAGQLRVGAEADQCKFISWAASLVLRSGARTVATIEVAPCPGPILAVPDRGLLVLGSSYSSVKALLPLPAK